MPAKETTLMDRMKLIVGVVVGVVAVASILTGGGVWYARAEGSHAQTRSNAEQLRILVDIKEGQETEKELIIRLCREKKLKIKDCPVGVHPDDKR